MSNKIVKMQKPGVVKENLENVDNIENHPVEDSNAITAKLLETVVSYIGELEYIKKNKDSIFKQLKPMIGLYANVNPVVVPHAPHIIRHASMGVLPTIDNKEYAKILLPENVLDKYVTDEAVETLFDIIVTLRGLISNVNSLVIASATLKDPSIHKKCFEISVTPLCDTYEAEEEYQRKSEKELYDMVTATISTEDIINIFERYLF